MLGRELEYRDRVVVITGASAGVGRATAKAFARAGAKVGLIARDSEALQDVADELSPAARGHHTVAADVSDADAVFAAADEIAERLGPIDVWVNDAMLTVLSPVWEMTPDEFRRVTETSYLGFVNGTMAALKHMRPRNKGAIVQVGSSLGYRGIPLQSAYCGAKHAIRGFTDSLHAELIHEGSAIRLTMVQLPAVNTPQFDWARTHLPDEPRPVPPVFQPEVPARAILKAARGHRREYWLGASTVKVILGSMAVPAFLDRYLARHAYGAQERQTPVAPGRRDNLEGPVHDLHRTRGSFGHEARPEARMFSGEGARAGIAGLGVLTFAAALLAARGAKPDRRDGRRRLR